MKLESYLRWLSIALFTALAVWVTIPVLAMVYSPPLRRINPFYWYLAADIVLWFIVIRFVLQEFYVRGQLHGSVKQFYENVLAHPIQALYRVFTQRTDSLGGRLSIIGLVVLGVVAILSAFNTLDERVSFFMRYPAFQRTVDQHYESHVNVLGLLTPDNNQERYLEACLKVARDLKSANASVMMMQLPYAPFTERYLQLVSEINRTGIVVFAPFDDFGYGRRGFRLAQHPMSSKLDIPWGVHSFNYTQPIPEKAPSVYFVDKFIPYGIADNKNGKTVPDIAVEALKKFTNASDITANDNAVIVGDKRLPVSNDGVLYSYQPPKYRPFYTTLTVDLGEEKNAPKYQYWITPNGKNMLYSETLTGHETTFRNKIVFVAWNQMGIWNQESWFRIGAMVPLIDNMIEGRNLLRKSESGPLYLTLFTVLLCGVLAGSMRGFYAIPIMLLVGIAVFLSGVWLLQYQQVWLDVSYPLAAVILSIAVFPLARFAWTMRAEIPAQPAPVVPEPLIAQPATGTAWFALSDKRLSLSLPLAALMLVIAIGGSVLLTSLLQQPEIQKEPVYIMSMPTVEVRGDYIPSNGSAQ